MSETKHTPPCDCGYQGCDGTTVLNGVRFTCAEGQYTYEFHIDKYPIYAAAPELLKSLKDFVALANFDADTIPKTTEEWDAMVAQAEAVISKAEAAR